MSHHTKDKGDIGTVRVIADLTEKGFAVFIPVVTEHLPFDIIGYKDGKMFRFQSKFRSKGFVSNRTAWTDKNGTHMKNYDDNAFDYYAIYLPEENVVCYPSIIFGGITLSTKINNSATPFYWYEDFLGLTDQAVKRSYKDFGHTLVRAKPKTRKSKRPSKEELEQLLCSENNIAVGKLFGVTEAAVRKWVKFYQIEVTNR